MDNLIPNTVGKHPYAATFAFAAIVVLVIIIAVRMHYRMKNKLGKDGMQNRRLTTNTTWWPGGESAAGHGSSTVAVAPDNWELNSRAYAVYLPKWAADQRKVSRAGFAYGGNTGREHFGEPGADGPAPAPATGGTQCPAGWVPDGKGRCELDNPDADYLGPITACARRTSDWDPAATAEAQALATVGALQHDEYGERLLQANIDLAFDSSPDQGLSNRAIAHVLNTGGMP